METVIGFVLGSSCTLFCAGIYLWATHRRQEQALLHGLRSSTLTIEESFPTAGGMTCLIAQFLLTVVTAAILYPGTPWRSETIAVVLVWLAAVLMLGIVGATYGVRRKRTTYIIDSGDLARSTQVPP